MRTYTTTTGTKVNAYSRSDAERFDSDIAKCDFVRSVLPYLARVFKF